MSFGQPSSPGRRRSWFFRRGPDPDLSRLPVSLDLRALSLAEGLRAALSVAALVALDELAGIPGLAEAALGSMLTCLCDAGGPIRRRLPALLVFGVCGALVTLLFGAVRHLPLLPVVLCTSAFIFCTSFARVWGQTALQVGNVLTVVAVLALDWRLEAYPTVALSTMFLAGSLWATALTLLIWRLHPYQPARRATADVFRRMAELVSDLASLLAREGATQDWAAHARAHRRHVREGLEQARTLVLDTIRGRGRVNTAADNLLEQVEAADQMFGALIALSGVLEDGRAAVREEARQALPKLRRLLAAIADAIEHERLGQAPAPEVIEQELADLASTGSSASLSGIMTSLGQRARIAAGLSAIENQQLEEPAAPPEPVRVRVLGPLKANFTWKSAALRHSTRAAVVSIPALLITLSSRASYAHWLTLTLVLTLQPFFALTWQRAVERIGGTVLGGIAAAGLALLVQSTVGMAALMFPLATLAFTVRSVSFGLFQACLTPMIVLLSELGQPGDGEIAIALWRAVYTISGGLLAVAGSMLLWPSWEPERLRNELRQAIRAHAEFADLELGALLGSKSESLDDKRRAAGMASNNLEASISRAMQEPRRSTRPELKLALVSDAALRRIAGRLIALEHAPALAGAADLQAWRSWLAAAFAALESGDSLPAPPPGPAEGVLARIARQIELIEGALRPADAAPPAAPSRPAPP